MARSTQVAARERAREALRRREAERAARDGMISNAAADYFAGDLLVEEGTAKMQSAIVRLLDELDETPASAAALLGLSVREVNKLRRDASATTDSGTAARESGDAEASGSATGDSEDDADQGPGEAGQVG